MELKVFGISETSYTVFWELTPGTQYFWRVDARSGEEEKEGIVWSFTTHSVRSGTYIYKWSHKAGSVENRTLEPRY